MSEKRVYKGIALENLDKKVHFSHSRSLEHLSGGRFEADKNTDYRDELLKMDKKVLSQEQFEKISALNSVVNMNYQINKGGIDQYFFNGYDQYRAPCHEQDVAQLDKKHQEDMLDELLFFGMDVYPEKEEEYQLLDEVISQFKKIFVEEEEQFETIYSDEEEKIWDEEREEYVDNPDYEEPEEVSVGFESVLWNDQGFNNKYFEVNRFLETLIEGYAQYLHKSISNEIIKDRLGIDLMIQNGEARLHGIGKEKVSKKELVSERG